MLKKLFLIALLTTPIFSFAAQSTLKVTPYQPDDWGYMGSYVTVNHVYKEYIGSGITISGQPNDAVELTVYAMNAKPKLADSCQNIFMREGSHELQFELGGDWLIHCRMN